MTLLSVVIPSYNHARFVAEAIASVAAQGVPDLELIVVDDGSTDGSPAAIGSALAQASLPGRFIQQDNQGAARAIARGVEAANGELLAILNSDDRFGPERFRVMLRCAPESGNFLAFSRVRMIDAAGCPWPDFAGPVRSYHHALYEASRCPTVGFALLRNNIAVTSGNLLFTRRLYEQLGGFADFSVAHDWDFLLRALRYVEPIFVPEVLLDYRTHGENTRFREAALGPAEGRVILNRFLEQCAEGTIENPLAPCERNWPVYFDHFVSRYHSWFGQGPIREWLEDGALPHVREDHASAWRSWSEVVDFERVDDSRYLVDPKVAPDTRAAIALAQDVLLTRSHPLAREEGSGIGTLTEVLERHAGRRGRSPRLPWHAPVDRELAPLPPRTPRWLRLGTRLTHSVANWLASHTTPLRRLGWALHHYQLVQRSGLFSARYYRSHCPDALGPIRNAVIHYFRHGAFHRIDPHPLFDTGFYLDHNPDVAASGMNPLVHFLTLGGTEGRNPSPEFDSRCYLSSNPDVAAAGVNPLIHYLRHGEAEGRRPNPHFDSAFYDQHCTEGREANEGPLAHYLRVGRARGVPTNLRQLCRHALEANDRRQRGDDIVPPEARERDRNLARRIRDSGFFDPDFYSAQAGSHFGDRGDPLRHFLEIGASMGVRFCPDDLMEERLSELPLDPACPELSYLGRHPHLPEAADRRVAIYVSSEGNAFFREIAALLAHGFERAGARVDLLDQRAEFDRDASDSIVVAPHEFFVLGQGPERISREFLARSFLWVAEQPGSEFFAICLWFARLARGVLDINPLTAMLWGSLGFHARALPLGFVDGFPDYAEGLALSPRVAQSQTPEVRDYAGRVEDAWDQRPLDLHANAVLTERRDRFFAKHAAWFADLRCALFLPTPHVPISARVASALEARDATALVQRARILLNIHRDEMPYFEWHRLVVRGIWQRTLVVTEPSLPVPGLEPGEHFVACRLEEMPRKLHWLLRTREGRTEAEAIRKRAFEALVAHYSLPAMAAAFLAERAGEDNS